MNKKLNNAEIATCKDAVPVSFVEVKEEDPEDNLVQVEGDPEKEKKKASLPYCKGNKGEIPLAYDGSTKKTANCRTGAAYTDLLTDGIPPSTLV